MMFIIAPLCILLVFVCIIAVALGITNVWSKWDDKRRAKEWNESIQHARQSRYWNPCNESQVEDVEYEDVTDVKLLERKL